MRIKKDKYIVEISKHGALTGLFGVDDHNWINPNENSFGLPFIKGTQWEQTTLECRLNSHSDSEVEVISISGKTKVIYKFEQNHININAMIPLICGPRAGIHLPFHLLDTPSGTSWEYQIMPHIIYTDREFQYAYFIFRRGDGKFLSLIIDSPFAAWRFLYSYQGHKITGMQLLSTADDLILPGNNRPKASEKISINLSLTDNLDSAMETVRSQLNLATTDFSISGGIPNTMIPLTVKGYPKKGRLISPNGSESALDLTKETIDLFLIEEGIYQVELLGESGRKHTSRLICYKSWKDTFQRVNQFYRDHFQHESGAFYRVIWQNSLIPDGGKTYEGVPFGSPEEHHSCRTGEFGGFAAWAMIKNLLQFGQDSSLRKSVDSYIKNWALNWGNPQKPLPGTVCREPQTFLGRGYGAFHLFEEVNYPQHEIFLMEELVDYYKLSGEERILDDLISLTRHFTGEHMDDKGRVLCQNSADGHEVDYTSVHTPLIALIKVYLLLEKEKHEYSLELKSNCLKTADFLVVRGFNFPTEGEPCTEDGSMSCSAGSLLYAYMYLEKKDAYKEMGEKLILAHELLSLEGSDCRIKGSSLRFWETQYESFDWGPSINAGHGWTLWMSEALLLLGIIKKDYSYIEKAWNGFMTNICKVEPTGAMTCSYTPDMIPGTPHYPGRYEPYEKAPDMIPSRTELAMGYQRKCYSASGNFLLIKAAEYWDHISGVDLTTGSTINGYLKEGVFHSDAPRFSKLFVRGNSEEKLNIYNPDKQIIEIIYS